MACLLLVVLVNSWCTFVLQVLANPTADIQEGPKVTKAELKARGVRPYDEKVCMH